MDFLPLEVANQYLNQICYSGQTGILNIASGKSSTFKELALFVADHITNVKINTTAAGEKIPP